MNDIELKFYKSQGLNEYRKSLKDIRKLYNLLVCIRRIRFQQVAIFAS